MNYTQLQNYASFYYIKYYPSKKKLINKLLEKSSWDQELVDRVISNISNTINDEANLNAKIALYKSKNKNFNYIKNKLTEKEFDKDLIQEKISILKEENDSLLTKEFIIRKAENYLQKGKSLNYIKQTLRETKEDSKLIDEVILEYFWDENPELDNLKKEIEKCKNIDKQKKIQRLMRKWFKYWDFKDLI